ncbi:carboxypeptidase-like regulatory domain-containing protein [Flavobacteriales bacterium]|nr:carboxypeptidase-like regulatory domain-containing protein [Flavobacteriales bacterium]
MFAWIAAAAQGTSQGASQGSIQGTVTDKATGELLLGATIILESNSTGTMSDFDGNYALMGLSAGTYKVVGRFIAYNTIEQEVVVGDNETVVLDFAMESAVIAIENEAIVAVRQNRSNAVYMENVKKKETSMIDYVSSQDIQKNGDSDVSSAIKRVSGVYTMGNFVVVRGLSDRYVRTALNGAEIPSLDPKRSSVSMDLFQNTQRQFAFELLRCVSQRAHQGLSGQFHLQLFHLNGIQYECDVQRQFHHQLCWEYPSLWLGQRSPRHSRGCLGRRDFVAAILQLL